MTAENAADLMSRPDVDGALVGGAIYDVVPAGEVPSIYVSLGPEDVRDASDQTGSGAEHRFAIATYALRRAKNTEDVRGAIERATSTPLHIVSGRQEVVHLVE